jgi:predicted ArsR family transcriptional regulator
MTEQQDTLNSLGVLKRREIEARLLIPLVEALAAEFGRERVLAIVRATILGIARRQGAQLAAQMNAHSLTAFGEALAAWKQDDALELEVLEQSNQHLAFNVTRCRYAEMYRALGVPELGALLSCNRDAALMEGFNGDVTFTRTQTIMDGAPFCDFRYQSGGPTRPQPVQ